jgi:hypothetical protein
MRRGCVLLLLAGCPKKGPDVQPPVQLGVGCPAASSVYVASYSMPDEEGGKGHTGWVLPLADKVGPVASEDYVQIDAAAASAAGVPAAPANLWMLGGKEPCKVTLGSYYQAGITDVPSPNTTYGVELAGCPAPPDPASASAIVLASDSPPHDCQIIPPRGIAARLGEVDKQGVWHRPLKDTPIPPVMAKVLPTKPCTPPACEPLWSVAEIAVGGKPVAWAGALNWLAIPDGAPPDKQCEWKAEKFSGFFVAGPDGTPVKVDEGQDHPLALTAVLADKTGPKVLVAEGPGEYSTYDLAGGAARVGRHLVWLLPTTESYDVVDHLGPVCEQ